MEEGEIHTPRGIQQEDYILFVLESSGAFFSSESNVGGQRKGKKAKKKNRKARGSSSPKGGGGPSQNRPFMISLGCWDVRLGVDPPSKQREVRHLLKNNNLSLCGLVETEVRSINKDMISRKVFGDWEVFDNYDHALLGRIGVGWDPLILKVTPMYRSDQIIHVFCSFINQKGDFRVSAVCYSSNEVNLRKALWADLKRMSSVVIDQAWIVMGDLNSSRFHEEKMGGSGRSHNTDLHQCLLDIDLFDLPFKGPLYTWSNRRDSEQIIARKLDRVLVNDSWLATFPNSEADFTGPGLSDHTPGIVTIRQKLVTGKKPFLFFNLWTSHEEFAPLVEQVLSTPVEGFSPPMFRLCTKLKGLKPELKIFNSKHYGSINSKVAQAREDLTRLQLLHLQDPSNSDLANAEKESLKVFTHFTLMEEASLKQKSRIQ